MNRPEHFFIRMRQIVLVLGTFFFASSVQADWTPLGRNENFRVYLEQKLIKRNGDFSQIWQLMDFTTAQWLNAQTAVWSMKYLVEYDCSQTRSRTLVGIAYSEQLESGMIVANDAISDPQWEDVEPGSITEKIRQLACAKR